MKLTRHGPDYPKLTKQTILRAFEWRPEADSVWKGMPVASQIFWDANKDAPFGTTSPEQMLERLLSVSRHVQAHGRGFFALNDEGKWP